MHSPSPSFLCNVRVNEPYFGQSAVWRDNISAYNERSRFKKHQKLTVYYDPTRPTIAIADVSIQFWTLLFTGIALLLYLLGLLCAYYTLDQLRRLIQSRRGYED